MENNKNYESILPSELSFESINNQQPNENSSYESLSFVGPSDGSSDFSDCSHATQEVKYPKSLAPQTKRSEKLNLSTTFLDGRENFHSPLVRKQNIRNRYIDTPLKTERQSSQLLLDSLNVNDKQALEFSLGIEQFSSRKSSEIKKSPFISSNLQESKKLSHLIFDTPEILNRILFFAFNHEDPYNLPPIYSQEYNTDSIIYTNKFFYSIGIKYVKERLVFKNYRQLQRFNDFYKYKKQQHKLSPKTLIINFGSDGVFKQQVAASDSNNLPKVFSELYINCNNITHLEIRSNRFIKELPQNLENIDNLKTLKLPGLCNLSTASFERLINHKNVSQLETLDLRNCYSISELSLFKVLTKSFELKHLNLNRKVLSSSNNSDKYFRENFTLSDNVLNAIQISKAPLETFAISGSKISDYGIWQLIALTPEVRLNLRRLSLNECFELKSDFFTLFNTGALPNLQVLELKQLKNDVDFEKVCKLLFELRLNQELQHSKPLSLVLDGKINEGVRKLQSLYNRNVGSVVLKELVTWVNVDEERK